ncbi:MAG: hypothetical protein MZV64_59270 [Ignavibacteriales bacterium]|nr:hypothetical protein [Ignavibacteriales bacterium]
MKGFPSHPRRRGPPHPARRPPPPCRSTCPAPFRRSAAGDRNGRHSPGRQPGRKGQGKA